MMASYYGMISEIDNGIGTILQKLKEKGLYDNTMIVFTSDHGDYMSYHHMMLKGRHLYDPGSRKLWFVFLYRRSDHSDGQLLSGGYYRENQKTAERI